MVSIEDESLWGGGSVLKQLIWDAGRDMIQAWTRQRLAESSLYGVRVYKKGSLLSMHVDRAPLVSSAIINVDQDVDEPWPLEIIGHDGIAYNVTMEPGDMVLYESHSILHGRPFPLKGRFMANMFIHFEPVGPIRGSVELNGDLPPYIIPGSPEEANWRSKNPSGHTIQSRRAFGRGWTEAHHYAHAGDLDGIKRVLDSHPGYVNARDDNGWTPLHMAVQTGSTEGVELLLERGADLYAKTGKEEQGRSPLQWAKKLHGNEHPLIAVLLHKIGETSAHHFAYYGDLETVKRALEKNPESLHARDKNGFMPLHEAVRSGSTELVEFLLARGADMYARTGIRGLGGTPLWWAKELHGSAHPVVGVLQGRMAEKKGPTDDEL